MYMYTHTRARVLKEYRIIPVWLTDEAKEETSKLSAHRDPMKYEIGGRVFLASEAPNTPSRKYGM